MTLQCRAGMGPDRSEPSTSDDALWDEFLAAARVDRRGQRGQGIRPRARSSIRRQPPVADPFQSVHARRRHEDHRPHDHAADHPVGATPASPLYRATKPAAEPAPTPPCDRNRESNPSPRARSPAPPSPRTTPRSSHPDNAGTRSARSPTPPEKIHPRPDKTRCTPWLDHHPAPPPHILKLPPPLPCRSHEMPAKAPSSAAAAPPAFRPHLIPDDPPPDRPAERIASRAQCTFEPAQDPGSYRLADAAACLQAYQRLFISCHELCSSKPTEFLKPANPSSSIAPARTPRSRS
jgi:hypothetical protein